MALNHGINTYKADTNYANSATSVVGVPFFVGCWPCHTAEGYAGGKAQLVKSFEEAKALGGFSYEWRDASGNPKWSLCQAAYSHFKIFDMTPALFVNVFDPATHKAAVEAASKTVTDHIVKLPFDAILDSSLSVADSEDTLVEGTDYEAYYDEEYLVIELISTSSHYSATTLTIGYNEVSLTAITSTVINAAIEGIEDCKTTNGIVPEFIVIPGWSKNPAVASVMATKAASINGLYKGMAIVDLDTSASACDSVEDIAAYKEANGYDDPNMIVCWPLVKVGAYTFDYSVILAGNLAALDHANGDVPFESPSNKAVDITGCCLADGTEVNLTVQAADTVSYADGVVTALNFNGWRVWGNYTGCWPSEDDVAKCYICTSRMMNFICNTFVDRYWDYVDRPLTRVLVDAVVASFNTYLAGLAHDGKIIGGEIAFVEDNNPNEQLFAGTFKLDCLVASPIPSQRIDLTVEFNLEALRETFNM